MKKVLLFALLLNTVSGSPLWAEEAPEAGEAKPVLLSSKQVSQEMAEVWCGKMEECSQEKSMSVKECQKILFKSFKTGFDRLPKENPLKLERAGFDECKANVAKGTCEGLKGAKALPGCEFISRLAQ